MQVVVSKYIFIIARYWVADLFNLSACLYIFYLLNFCIFHVLFYISLFLIYMQYIVITARYLKEDGANTYHFFDNINDTFLGYLILSNRTNLKYSLIHVQFQRGYCGQSVSTIVHCDHTGHVIGIKQEGLYTTIVMPAK